MDGHTCSLQSGFAPGPHCSCLALRLRLLLLKYPHDPLHAVGGGSSQASLSFTSLLDVIACLSLRKEIDMKNKLRVV